MLVGILINSVSIYIASRILSGVELKNFWSAIWVALALGLVNAFVKPIVVLFSLPLTVITLGLFAFVINALMIMLVDMFIDSFKIKNFGWALAFSIVVSVISSVLASIF